MEGISTTKNTSKELDVDCKSSQFSKGITYETIDELAQRTKMTRGWWYGQTRKIGKGSVPRIKKGKYLLFIPYEVDKWLKVHDN